MNKSLKYLCFLFALIMSISAFAISSCTLFENYVTGPKGLKYVLNEDGISYSCNGIGKVTETDITIASLYKGLPVTSIGKSAFSNCTSITSITIPDSVTSIGNSAFYYCTGITNISIGNSVTSIGNEAFRSCNSLESITIPDSVTSIGSEAFYLCRSLKNITISDNVTSIGSGAFYYCDSLESLIIPNGVTSVDTEVFMFCLELKSITLPDSITSIDRYAFFYCKSLESIYYEGTIEQWYSIRKDNWHGETGEYIIFCTDGEITKRGKVTKY